MQNQNKSVMGIDDRQKGRKGIEEMLERMSNLKKEPDAEFDNHKNKRETA